MPTLIKPFSRIRSVRSPFSKRSASGSSQPECHGNTSPTWSHLQGSSSDSRHKTTLSQYHPTKTEQGSPKAEQQTKNDVAYSSHAKSFAETLQVISREAQNTQFDDVFGAFFFSEKRCRNRALFMTARLKHALNLPNDMLAMMAHRLYTWNYLLFVLPPSCEARARHLSDLERHLQSLGDGQTARKRAGMETYFSMHYCLEKQHITDDALIERARVVLAQCLESETKLGHGERDAMYVFHALRAGLHETIQPRIEVGDTTLRKELLRAVKANHQAPTYTNPFEDDSAVVRDDCDSKLLMPSTMNRTRHGVDSGFYDSVTLSSCT